MNHLAELEILNSRWEALDKAIEIHEGLFKKWFQQLEKDQVEPSPRAKTLHCLLKRLRAFADGHFNRFYNGFRPNGEFENQISDKYPPGHVLDVILDQIGKDLDVIRRATADEALSSNGLVTTTLNRADCLALEALKPAEKLGLARTAVVNYFQRSAVNRVVPYDNDSMALFGLPFTTVCVPKDYLATPHEVGHYVFWNGQVRGIPIWVKLGEDIENDSNIPEWVKPWLEEIFADVYGCLVAGPVIALDFQDMQLLESEARFNRDDGEHPAPVVRPYVYTEVLKKRDMEAWADRLEARWQDRLNERYNDSERPTDIMLQRSDLSGLLSSEMGDLIDWLGYYRVPLENARDEMGKVVDLVYDLLNKVGLDFKSNWWGQFSSPDVTSEELEQLYRQFEEQVTGLTLDMPLYDPGDCEVDGLYAAWTTKITAMGAYQVTGCEDEFAWCRIWDADGWATNGPNGRD